MSKMRTVIKEKLPCFLTLPSEVDNEFLPQFEVRTVIRLAFVANVTIDDYCRLTVNLWKRQSNL